MLASILVAGYVRGWVDGLVDEAAAELDPERRMALYTELQRLAMSEVTGIYLQQGLDRYYWRKEVEGSYVTSLVPGGYYYMLRKRSAEAPTLPAHVKGDAVAGASYNVVAP